MTLLNVDSLIVSANAAELEGVTVPATVEVGDATLALNGLGLRSVRIAFIEVDVYVAALYLSRKSNSADEIIGNRQPMQMELHFLRDVSAERMSKAWREGFAANVEKTESQSSQIEELCSLMRDLQKGDVMKFIWSYPTKDNASVEITVNGQTVGTIQGDTFASDLLKVWIGANPPNQGLKEGLLGLRQ